MTDENPDSANVALMLDRQINVRIANALLELIGDDTTRLQADEMALLLENNDIAGARYVLSDVIATAVADHIRISSTYSPIKYALRDMVQQMVVEAVDRLKKIDYETSSAKTDVVYTGGTKQIEMKFD